jgi:two-component system phosphate regulon sensor histidine kinase PhoR
VKQQRFLFSWIIIIGTIPLLGILALNQFNWLQELRRRERDRIESNMINSVSSLSEKIQYEIRFLPNVLGMTQDAPINEVTFAQQFRFWKNYATTPSILKRVMFLRDAKQDSVEWRNGSFVPIDKETARNFFTSRTVTDGNDEIRILYPLHSQHQQRVFLACVYDKNALVNVMIPQLAEETLKNANLYGYRIVDTKTDTIVYASADDLPDSSFRDPDIVMPIGWKKAEEIPFQKAYDIQQVLALSSVNEKEIEPDRQFATNPLEKVGGSLDATANLFPYLAVEIVNKDGSLEDMFWRSTIQNAILSFSIVILLLIGMAVLAEATRRSRDLALRQNEFVATVTHELKTPLAVITSAAQNLADGFVRDREKTMQYGAMIKKEASRLGVSIEHFLLYSRTGSQRRVKSEECDIQDLVESALKFTEDERVTNKFTTEVVMPEYPLFVEGDRIALESVFRNLAQNVVRHAREGRYMGIIVSEETCKKRKDGRCVVIKVRDKGHGISPREQKTIFDPFVRGSYAMSNQIPGNGIGLNLVKRIVTVHGGSVTVESRTGSGSTFIVTLPESGGELHGNQDSDDRG